MAIFACSFDAASPLAPWTTSSGVSIVAGRDVHGATSTFPLDLLNFTGSLGSSIAAGSAFAIGSFSNSLIHLADTGGGIGQAFANIDNTGDGRMNLTVGASSMGSSGITLDGFVQNFGLWNYYEIVADIIKTVTPVDATHSNLQIQVNASVYVNNALIGSESGTWIALNIVNTSLPIGSFSSFTLNTYHNVVDDVYVNTTRIGDCFVASDDATITVETAAPDLTQTVVEVGLINPAAAPDITQSPIEVGLAPLTFTIACPVSVTATVGVNYTGGIVVVGGTPPYTFAIISGSLPPGLTLNTSTGVISGIPLSPGSFGYIAQVTDSLSNVISTDPGCLLVVSQVMILCPTGSGTATVGILFTSNPPVVSGDTPPDTFMLVSGPPWMSINPTTGVVSGIPIRNGSFSYVILVTDSFGATATTAPGCTVAVSCPPQFFPGSGGNHQAQSSGDTTGNIVLPKFQPGKGGNRFGNN